MSQGKPVYTVLLLLGSILFVNPLQAACDQTGFSDASYQEMLEEFAAGSCLHFDNNNTALGRRVKQQLNNNEQDDRVRAIAALSSIQEYLEDSLISTGGAQSVNAAALESAIEELKQGIAENPETPQKGLKARWKFKRFDRMPEALEHIELTQALTAEKCSRVSDQRCVDEYEMAADLVRVMFLANAAVDIYTQNYRAETLVDRVVRRTKWDSYYDDLTFQYPWELLANNFLLEKYDNNRGSVDGNKIGFRHLPKSKLVLLHPEANLVYADNAQDEYEVTLTFEAIGYEAFDFDANGKVKNPWGVSLLAAYMDQADKAESGWTAGLLFKYNGYSLGFTDNHGDTGIVFNVNLSQRIFNVKKQSRRYYDEYQGKVQRLGILLEEGQQRLDEARQVFVISE